MAFMDFIKKRKAEEAKEEKKYISNMDQAKKELAKVSKEMREAATAGDIEKYNQLEEETRRLRNNIVVLESSKNIRSLTDQEVSQAWKEYCAEYNKRYNAQYEKYLEAKGALYTQFRKLADIQNDGLKEAAALQEDYWERMASVRKLDFAESKVLFKLLDGLFELREKENIENIISGSPVEDIDTTKTLQEIINEKSKERCKKVRAARAEYERRRKILHDVFYGRASRELIDWVDFSKMTKEEIAKWNANINYAAITSDFFD